MIRVFVSYASADSQIVNRLVSYLTAVGYAVWIDRATITGGEMWRARIVEAIEESDVFLLALSPNSVTSKHVLQELNIADTERKPILPVLIAAVEVPKEMKLQLSGLQKIFFGSGDLSNLDVLYKSINQLIAAKTRQ